MEKTRGSSFGLFLAMMGVLVISPDTLLIRLSGLDGWSLTAWRGMLVGCSMIALWVILRFSHLRVDLKACITYPIPFLYVVVSAAVQNVTFNFAAIEASVTIVLTSLATMPLVTAVLSYFFLKEIPNRFTWVAMVFTITGVLIVVLNGHGATDAPQGSVLLAGVLGMICAVSLASVFVMVRIYPALPMIMAMGLGSLSGAMFAFGVDPTAMTFSGNLLPVLIMGFLVIPISFTLLLIAPKYTSSTNVSLILLLEMVLGPIWVWLAIGERPSLIMGLGSAIVLVAIVSFVIVGSRENQGVQS